MAGFSVAGVDWFWTAAKVAGVAATEVARYISQNLPFDRLYLYGDDRPLHVSIGPEHSRLVYRLELLASGRRVPRRVVGW